MELDLLQEYCLIALDVFRKTPYSKDRSEQTAWLSLLATEDVEEAGKLIQEYPWLEKEIEQQKLIIAEKERQVQEKDAILEQQRKENEKLKQKLDQLLEKNSNNDA